MRAFFIVAFLILFYPKQAYAYLDPGSGSYFLQLVLGIVLGILVSIKLYFKKIKIFFEELFNKPPKKGSQ